MARTAFRRTSFLVTTAAALAWNCADASPRHQHARSSSGAAHHHSHPAPVAPVVYRPAAVVTGYVPSYAHSYASRQPLTFSRTAVTPPYYVPAQSPNAPPFSFNGSEEVAGWNWRRVSLQEIDAEVRARRAAQAADKPNRNPAYRQYCPDSRVYQPEVTQCASNWLTVLSNAPAAKR